MSTAPNPFPTPLWRLPHSFRGFVFAWVVAGLFMPLQAQPAQQPGPFGLQPPPGIAVPKDVQAELQSTATSLGNQLAELKLSESSLSKRLWPDVAIYHKAVDWALRYNEFQSTNQFSQARELLQLGIERAAQLRSGSAPWTNQVGLVTRGFISSIDDSVQPYAMVIPESWQRTHPPYRLDVWLAGRDEKRTELKFLWERLHSKGEFFLEDALVLHPYGRYGNAFKFAGETDVFEAVQHAETAYHSDPLRRSIRGFSMGGAGTWHLAAHHPMFWRAAAPGAGFVDTATYTGILRQPDVPPPWEQTLWKLYDVPGYASSFHQLDVVAYSGENDQQKLAADTMATAFQREGLTLNHIIGPGVEHKYEPGAKLAVARQMDTWMQTPKETSPRRLEFKTFTTKYPSNGRVAWFQLESLFKQWESAEVLAELTETSEIRVQVSNVAAFRLIHPPGMSTDSWKISINGQSLTVKPELKADSLPEITLELHGSKWRPVRSLPSKGKHPGVQGPIDDAFMSRFLVVRPTGKPWRPEFATWTDAAIAQFQQDWRGQFRGEVRIKNDTEVTDKDVEESHLILWGDPSSNRLIGNLMKDVPIGWGRRKIYAGQLEIPAEGHFVSFIYPNPRNLKRYVVVNSGHTFARWNGTNARQTPWLPDWAIRELSPSHVPRGTIAAGFFDDRWAMP